jgi:hypothetical protein
MDGRVASYRWDGTISGDELGDVVPERGHGRYRVRSHSGAAPRARRQGPRRYGVPDVAEEVSAETACRRDVTQRSTRWVTTTCSWSSVCGARGETDALRARTTGQMPVEPGPGRLPAMCGSPCPCPPHSVFEDQRVQRPNERGLTPSRPPSPSSGGMGFIRVPELTWEHFDDSADVGHVGQQIDEPLALDPLLQSG